MYKLVGADQKEYGPVTAEQLRQWICEGRANAQTMVQTETEPAWRPLGSVEEFADCFPKAVTLPPLVQTRNPPAAGVLPKTNNLAIAGLVLSALGLTCCPVIFSTLGLILSVVALAQIQAKPAQESGRGLAMAGIVIAVLGYAITFILYASGITERIIRELTR